jgi:hypothetical protein
LYKILSSGTLQDTSAIEDTAPRRNLLPIVWLAISLCFVLWQPVRLGFYLDDWPQILEPLRHGPPFSAALWHYFQVLDPTRPGFVLLRYLLSSVLGQSPFVWQTALLVSNILVSVSLAHLGLELWGRVRKTSWAASLGAGAAWLLFPWNAAVGFWPSLVVLSILLAAFAWTAVLLVRGWRKGATWSVLPAVLYCAICISYEALYFQFIPLALIGIVLARQRSVDMRAVFRSSASMATAQAVAVLWHVYLKMAGYYRPIEAKWPLVFLSNLWHLVPEMILSAYELRIVIAGFVILLLYFACAGFVRHRQKIASELEPVLAIIVICITGTVLSEFAFALGGRGIEGTGVGSRVFCLCSWWIVLGTVALAAGLGPLWRTKEGRRIAAAAAGLGCVLGAAHVLRADEWARAWESQERILMQAPLPALLRTEPDATIVFVSRATINRAPIFAAEWDLKSAVPDTYGPRFTRNYVAYSPREGPLFWDRRQLRRAAQGSGIPATKVYIWRAARGTLERATKPFRIDTDLSVTALEP